jgi:hypothetical protein
MIDALIGGKLHGKPVQRTGPSGKQFVVAKVRTPLQDGDSIFVSVICFDAKVGASLMALDDGDSVALSGTLTPKVYAPPNGEVRPALDMICHGLLTPYHVNRKRKELATKSEVA